MKGILIVIILLFSSVAFAQEDDKDLSKQINMLNKEIANKDKRISRLEAEVQKLQDALSVSDSLLRFEKEQSKTALLKKQIFDLQQDTAIISANFKSEIATIKAEDDETIKTLKLQHKQDLHQIDSLKKELKNLEYVKKEMFAQMIANVDNIWMKEPFSTIDSVNLTNELKRYEKYSNEDKSVKTAYLKLQKLYDDFIVYKNSLKAVNSVYDSDNVNRLKKLIAEICKTTQLDQNKSDLKNLYNQLDDYKVTVEIFKEIIMSVDKRITTEKSKPEPNIIGLTASIVAFLEKQEKDYKYISAINEIPYLSTLYADYESALKADCFSVKVTEIANKVKNINTDN